MDSGTAEQVVLFEYVLSSRCDFAVHVGEPQSPLDAQFCEYCDRGDEYWDLVDLFDLDALACLLALLFG